jgi:hypothetical protein
MQTETKLILNALRITVTDTELELIIKAYELAKAKGDKVTIEEIKQLK